MSNCYEKAKIKKLSSSRKLKLKTKTQEVEKK